MKKVANSKNEGGVLLNNAFTLLELLGVIIILAVIALITVPIIDNSIKSSRQKAYEVQVDLIEEAAKEYSIEHEEILPMNDGVFTNQVMVSDLIKLGYIEKGENGKIYSPIDNSIMNGCVNIKFDLEYNQYTYIYDNDCLPQTVINYDSYYINYGGLYNEVFYEGVATSDGNYVAVGRTNSKNIEGLDSSFSNISYDILVVKFDKSGNILWQDVLAGSNLDDVTNVIEIEENNKKYYIVVGTSFSINGDFTSTDATTEYQKPIIVKYDESGNVVSKKIFVDAGAIYSIKPIKDGYIATATINNDTYKGEIYNNKINNYNGYGDAAIMKLNNNFEVEWSSYFGGTNTEIFQNFIVTDFGYVAVGLGRSADGDMEDICVDTATYVYDAIIVSYDKEGNLLNKEAFGSSADDSFTNLIAVDNSYIAVGYASENDLDLANTGKSGAIIVKYDKNLNLEKYTVFENNNANDFTDIILDDDRIIIVGNVVDRNLYDDGVILEINKDLKVIKQEKFKGNNSDIFNFIIKDGNNYIIFGGTSSKGNSIYDTLDPYLKGNQDAIMLSYDENFSLIKKFNKMVDTELIPKEVVKNYGTSIPSYENKDNIKLYTTNNPSEDISNWCDTNSIYSGEKDNYNYAYCLRPFNGSDIISLYEKTNNNGVSYIKGLHDYKMNINTDKVDLSNSWFRIFFYHNYPLSEIKLIFNDKKYTIRECVELGYIEPLVIYGYNSSLSSYLPKNSYKVLDGTLAIDNEVGSNSRTYVFFKTKVRRFEGISLNHEGNPDDYRSFTLDAFRNFEISLSKAN